MFTCSLQSLRLTDQYKGHMLYAEHLQPSTSLYLSITNNAPWPPISAFPSGDPTKTYQPVGKDSFEFDDVFLCSPFKKARASASESAVSPPNVVQSRSPLSPSNARRPADPKLYTPPHLRGSDGSPDMPSKLWPASSSMSQLSPVASRTSNAPFFGKVDNTPIKSQL